MDETLFGEYRLTAKQIKALSCMKGVFVFIGWSELTHHVTSYAFIRRYKRIARVRRIGVAPGCHGRGIGSTVLNAMQDYTLKPLSALVCEQWLGAQLFFRACGFQAVGRPVIDSAGEYWYRFVRGVGWESSQGKNSNDEE